MFAWELYYAKSDKAICCWKIIAWISLRVQRPCNLIPLDYCALSLAYRYIDRARCLKAGTSFSGHVQFWLIWYAFSYIMCLCDINERAVVSCIIAQTLPSRLLLTLYSLPPLRWLKKNILHHNVKNTSSSSKNDFAQFFVGKCAFLVSLLRTVGIFKSR